MIIGIFISSSQTYEEQTLIPMLKEWLPGKPLNSLLSFLHIPYWGIQVSIEERGYYAFIEFLIRKGTHVVTFGLLAIATYIMTKRIVWSFIIVLIIAVIDELHQSLTSGRTAAYEDVILDGFGAFMALAIIVILKKGMSKK